MRNLENYQKKYLKLAFEDIQAKYRKKKIIEILEHHAPKSILEIGCGMDSIFNYFTNCELITVIEPCKNFYENALRQSKNKPSIEVINLDLVSAVKHNLEPKYDFILLSSLLHELPKYQEILDYVFKLCSRDTIVHINVPNARSFHRLLALKMGIIEDVFEKSDTQKNMQQFHTFDIQSLKSVVTSCGFDIIDEGSYFLKPFTHSQMAWLKEINFLDEKMLMGFYELTSIFPDNGSEIYVNVKRRNS